MAATGRREHQAVRLGDGRLLGFAEYGAADGDAVLFFHGEVGSRLLGRPLDPAARRLGLRIVAPDRPGMGFSDFQADRTVADWPSDVLELAGQLGIERFAVVGASRGAPYALACAWKAPERLTAAVVASPVPPVSMTEHPPVLSRAAVAAPWTVRVVMTLLAGLFRRAPEQALGRMEQSAGEADRPVFARPEIRSMLAESMAETFRSGPRGPAHDLRLVTADWGIPLDRIAVPVDVWRGEADLEVPPAKVRQLADALPRSQIHLVPGAGHHLLVARPEVVLDALKAQGRSVD